MIIQTRRHPMRPAHVHFSSHAPGHEPLITTSYRGRQYLDSDVVFGVKNELIAKVESARFPLIPGHAPALQQSTSTGPRHAPKPMMAVTEDA